MTTYIQNYGLTKTIVKENNNKPIENEIKWIGDYDGDIANIQLAMNENGHTDLIKMQLNNDDLANLLGVQPVEKSLDKRLMDDFLKSNDIGMGIQPITLDGIFKPKRRHYITKKHKNKKRHNNKSFKRKHRNKSKSKSKSSN